MTGFYTKFTTTPEDRDALVGILSKAAEGMGGVEDCKEYVVGKDTKDMAVTWVSERWADRDAHHASLQVPGARELINEAMPLLTEGPEQIELEIIGGKGL